jgi:hypothetical protein
VKELGGRISKQEHVNDHSLKGPFLMSYVYVMKNFANGYYKIGFSKKPSFREKTLQAEEPDVRLLVAIPGDKVLEKHLHTAFKQYRMRGEWFLLSGVEMYDLADRLGVPLERIDPPCKSFHLDDELIVEVHNFGQGKACSYIRSTTTGKCLLQVEYPLTRAEADEEWSVECVSGLEIEIVWQDNFLRKSFRCCVLERYKPNNGPEVELIELQCRAKGVVRGYYVDAKHTRSRLFDRASKREARIFYNRWKRNLDAYYPPKAAS